MGDAMQVDTPTGTRTPQFSEALENIWAARKGGWASLQKCVLRSVVDDRGGLVNAAAPGGPTLCAVETVDTMFDLSFLDPVRRADHDFLPQRLFVRREVQDMVTKLATQCPSWKSRVLTGSPGIGKSVVFFLAAVQRAATLDQPLIYLRKTKEEKNFISVFIMKKRANAGGGSVDVDVVFGRKLPVKRNRDLTELDNAIRDASGLPDEDFYVMLDGPKHNDEKPDLLYNAYDCLCTSGGYPAVSQEEIGVKEIYVLSGWTEAKITEAMEKLSIQDPQNKYNLCGGRIRLASMPDKDIKTWFDSVVGSIGRGAIQLAVTSNAATGCLESSDRLRTRFFRHTADEREVSETIVDSRYAFNLLKERLDRSDILDAYNLAKALGLKAAQGWFYEETLHRCFQELKTQHGSLIQDWRHEEGSGAEGVASFIAECAHGKTCIYWAPGIPNFPNIDAAILLEPSTLTCFQYTVQASHAFDKQSFGESFVSRFVLGPVPIECVRVVFATPSDVTFNMEPHEPYEVDFSNSEGTHTRTSQLSRISVSFSHVSVDATSAPDDVAAKLLFPNQAG